RTRARARARNGSTRARPRDRRHEEPSGTGTGTGTCTGKRRRDVPSTPWPLDPLAPASVRVAEDELERHVLAQGTRGARPVADDQEALRWSVALAHQHIDGTSCASCRELPGSG